MNRSLIRSLFLAAGLLTTPGCIDGTAGELGTVADAFFVVPDGDPGQGWAQARATAKSCPASDDPAGGDAPDMTCDLLLDMYDQIGGSPDSVEASCCTSLFFPLAGSSMADLDGAELNSILITECYGAGEPGSTEPEQTDATATVSLTGSTATVALTGQLQGQVRFSVCE